jgi:hypothetical protein
MAESPPAQTGSRLCTTPRIDVSRKQGQYVSRKQGQFWIPFDFPGWVVREYDDHGYWPLVTAVVSFMDPGTLIRMHQLPERGDVLVSAGGRDASRR